MFTGFGPCGELHGSDAVPVSDSQKPIPTVGFYLRLLGLQIQGERTRDGGEACRHDGFQHQC